MKILKRVSTATTWPGSTIQSQGVCVSLTRKPYAYKDMIEIIVDEIIPPNMVFLGNEADLLEFIRFSMMGLEIPEDMKRKFVILKQEETTKKNLVKVY